jgi:hypothetical protein
MLDATRDLAQPTTITGSTPRPPRLTCVAITLGADIVRRELKLPEVEIPAADPRWTFAG